MSIRSATRGHRRSFEIAYALFQRKLPVLAICNSEVQNISSMLTGCDSTLLTIQKYRDEDDMKKIVRNYISKFSEK